MREIIFEVKESEEGELIVSALNYSIFTDGDTIQELRENIKDAIRCHFDDEESK
ncbi:UNVERIFIED_CONTAM: hypothetical protein GTU68_060832, partial [Idotea baltica]|nr:hypothetical protein [Idotea baltica]